MRIPSFNLVGLLISEEREKTFSSVLHERERRGKKDKIEKVGKHKSLHLSLLSHNIFGHSQSVNKFEDSGSHRSREMWQRISHTIQKDIPNICIKFQTPRHKFPEKFWTQIFFCITLEREMNKVKKEGKTNLTTLFFFLSFPQYIWPLSRCIRNMKTQAVIGAESLTEDLIGEKEKCTNNGKDKQEKADSLSHNTKSHT